jgi:hypothetical protein
MGEAEIMPKYEADKSNRVVLVQTEKSWGADAIYCIATIPPKVDLSAYLDEDGVYKIGYSLLHASNNRASMANQALVDYTGYFEVEKGVGRLYMALKGVNIGGGERNEYLTDIFSREGGYGGAKTRGEYLSYLDAAAVGAETIWSFTDKKTGIKTYHSLNYPHYVRMPLFNPGADGYYGLSFIVPIMDGLDGGAPGSGKAEAQARLLIHSIEKVDGANPYAVPYDKTMIGAAVQDATAILMNHEENGGLTEAQISALNAAIDAAQTVYDTDPTDQEQILNTRDALLAVIAGLSKTELNALIASAAQQYEESAYVADSWAIFAAALQAARATAKNAGATGDEIDAALKNLQAAADGLVPVGADVDKNALLAKIEQAKAIERGNYTAESHEALQAAIADAEAVASNTDATQTQVNARIAALNARIAALAVETAALDRAILAAKAYGQSPYEENSYAALAAAIAAAEFANDGTLRDMDVTKQINALNAAVAALAPKADIKYRLAGGKYSLANKTELLNFVTNNDSMGNAAIDHEASYLEISNGGADARVHLIFNPLTADFGGSTFTGYLLKLDKVTKINYDNEGYINGYEVDQAQVHEDWGTERDDYWRTEYGSYPKNLSLPVTIGQSEITVHVFVPVMEAINPTSGDQLARLRIDWSDFDLTEGGAETADTSGLAGVIKAARAVAEGSYAGLSFDALAASVAAGEYLTANKGIKTVSQTMVNTREAAIRAAQAALIFSGEIETVKKEIAVAPAVENDKATSAIAKDTVSALIADALASANGAGTQVGPLVIEGRIDVKPSDMTDIKETETSISKEAIEEAVSAILGSAGIDDVVLTVDTGITEISLDGDTLAKLASALTASGADGFEIVTGKPELTAAEKAVAGDKEVVEIILSIASASGAVTVILPYVPETGEDASKLRVFKLEENGSSAVPGSYYDDAKKAMLFKTAI